MSALNLYVALCTVGMIVFAYYATKWKVEVREARAQISYLEERQKQIMRMKYVQAVADSNVRDGVMYMLVRDKLE